MLSISFLFPLVAERNTGLGSSQEDYSVWKTPSHSHHESFLKPGDGTVLSRARVSCVAV